MNANQSLLGQLLMLTANLVVNLSGMVGTSVGSRTDVSFDTKTGNFTKYNVGISFFNPNLIAAFTLNDKGDTLTALQDYIVKPLTNTTVSA
uniref:Legume lectin domain-containing protein n=1 Tax=Lactuca sativa TaxID=4236 RepID=A0A9R1UYP5_LACSA|nr:hypothetical protein LSAT_V11C700361050 [Lactuca sativa]